MSDSNTQLLPDLCCLIPLKKRNAESEDLEIDLEWKHFLNYAYHTNESLVLEISNKFPAHVTLRSCDEILLETVSPIINGSMGLGPFWVQYLYQLVHEERCAENNKLIIISTPAEQPSSPFEASFNLTRFKGCLTTQNAESEFEEIGIRQDANRVGLYNVKIARIVNEALTHKTTEQMVISYGSGRPISLRFSKCNLLIKEIIAFNGNKKYEVDENLLIKLRMLHQTVCGTESIDSGISVLVISDHRLVTTLKFHLQPVTVTTQSPETTTTEVPATINVEEPGMIKFLNWVGEGKVEIDLRHILNISSNFMMLDIYSSEPITFTLEKQHRELIGRSVPFTEERFYFGGPWIPHLTRLSEVVTPDEVHNFTLKFSTGGKKASGHFRFSKSKKIRTQDAGRMSTKEIVNVHQDSTHPVVYYLALGKLIGDATQNRSLTLRLNSFLSEMVTVGFGKCETNMMHAQLNRTDSLAIDQDLLDHMDRMNNLFCISDRNLGRFDLAVFSEKPTNGTLHFGFDRSTEEEPIPVITIVAGIVFGLLAAIGLCVFLVRRCQNQAQILLKKNKPAAQFENRLSAVYYNNQSQLVDFSTVLGPIEELDDGQSDSGLPFEAPDSIKLMKMQAVDRVHYRTGRLQELKWSSGSNTIRSTQQNRPCTSVWVENEVYENNAAISDDVQPSGEMDANDVDETELYSHDDGRGFFE